MKRISSLLLGATLAIVATAGFAAGTTELKSNWTCTTNASSSDASTDKNADTEMSKNAKSAKDAFAFASKNCRDCTKITCETSSTN